MKNTHLLLCSTLLVFFFSIQHSASQTRTVGLLQKDSGAFNGYTLFAPMNSTMTYLIDIDGRLVNSWNSSYQPGAVARLTPNGELLRAGSVPGTTFGFGGGAGGQIELFNWDGTLKWTYRIANDIQQQHHDVIQLPNGNIIAVVWDRKLKADNIAAGRDTSLHPFPGIWLDQLIEVKPIGKDSGVVVWEWHAWEHLVQEFDSTKKNYGVVRDHAELIDFNFTTASTLRDWLHVNAVAYNPELDQLMLTIHGTHEIWVIDHSTTMAESKGHTGGRYGKGGDLLYRWGNPQVYKMGSNIDQVLCGQHDAHWIEPGLPGAGNVLVFNNGLGCAGVTYSRVMEFRPPVDAQGVYHRVATVAFGPIGALWEYMAPNPPDFYAANISGAQRLPNGNTLICSGPQGIMFEVTNDKRIVWKYVNPVTDNGPLTQGEPVPGSANWVFRAYRYAADYPGLVGRDLKSGDFIEKYRTGVGQLDRRTMQITLAQNYPNPAHEKTTITFTVQSQNALSHFDGSAPMTLVISDLVGREVLRRDLSEDEVRSGNVQVATSQLRQGVYLYRLITQGISQQRLMTILH